MSKLRLILCLFVVLCLPVAANAQRLHKAAATTPTAAAISGSDERIVAVVNESIISSTDLRSRMALALFSANMQDTPDARQRLFPQVLRNMIDEQLQLQEGKRLDIMVSSEEVKQGLDRMARQNDIPGGDIKAYLKLHGVPPETLEKQARAALTWNKVVMRELRPRIEVGEDEINAAIALIKSNAGKQESLVSEIFLAVDSPKDEDQVKAFADHLVQQIKSGTNFGAVARQFSQGTGAANGGDIGWIQEGHLSPELNKALQIAHTGAITSPIRTSNGYHILGIREQRTVAGGFKEEALRLQQVFTPFSPSQTKETVLKEAVKLRQSANGCTNLAEVTKKEFPRWHWMDLGTVSIEKTPAWIVEKTKGMKEGQSSEPMATEKGALILFLCHRDEPNAGFSREEVMSTIGTERLELLARRQLRDLRRSAYLDIRANAAP